MSRHRSNPRLNPLVTALHRTPLIRFLSGEYAIIHDENDTTEITDELGPLEDDTTFQHTPSIVSTHQHLFQDLIPRIQSGGNYPPTAKSDEEEGEDLEKDVTTPKHSAQEPDSESKDEVDSAALPGNHQQGVKVQPNDRPDKSKDEEARKIRKVAEDQDEPPLNRATTNQMSTGASASSKDSASSTSTADSNITAAADDEGKINRNGTNPSEFIGGGSWMTMRDRRLAEIIPDSTFDSAASSRLRRWSSSEVQDDDVRFDEDESFSFGRRRSDRYSSLLPFENSGASSPEKSASSLVLKAHDGRHSESSHSDDLNRRLKSNASSDWKEFPLQGVPANISERSSSTSRAPLLASKPQRRPQMTGKKRHKSAPGRILPLRIVKDGTSSVQTDPDFAEVPPSSAELPSTIARETRSLLGSQERQQPSVKAIRVDFSEIESDQVSAAEHRLRRTRSSHYSVLKPLVQVAHPSEFPSLDDSDQKQQPLFLAPDVEITEDLSKSHHQQQDDNLVRVSNKEADNEQQKKLSINKNSIPTLDSDEFRAELREAAKERQQRHIKGRSKWRHPSLLSQPTGILWYSSIDKGNLPLQVARPESESDPVMQSKLAQELARGLSQAPNDPSASPQPENPAEPRISFAPDPWEAYAGFSPAVSNKQDSSSSSEDYWAQSSSPTFMRQTVLDVAVAEAERGTPWRQNRKWAPSRHRVTLELPTLEELSKMPDSRLAEEIRVLLAVAQDKRETPNKPRSQPPSDGTPDEVSSPESPSRDQNPNAEKENPSALTSPSWLATPAADSSPSSFDHSEIRPTSSSSHRRHVVPPPPTATTNTSSSSIDRTATKKAGAPQLNDNETPPPQAIKKRPAFRSQLPRNQKMMTRGSGSSSSEDKRSGHVTPEQARIAGSPAADHSDALKTGTTGAPPAAAGKNARFAQSGVSSKFGANLEEGAANSPTSKDTSRPIAAAVVVEKFSPAEGNNAVSDSSSQRDETQSSLGASIKEGTEEIRAERSSSSTLPSSSSSSSAEDKIDAQVVASGNRRRPWADPVDGTDLEEADDDTMLAYVYREFGHWYHSHALAKAAAQQLLIAVFFILCAVLSRYDAIYDTAFGPRSSFAGGNSSGDFPLVLKIALLLATLLAPLVTVSRLALTHLDHLHEVQADLFAASEGHGLALGQSLERKLRVENNHHPHKSFVKASTSIKCDSYADDDEICLLTDERSVGARIIQGQPKGATVASKYPPVNWLYSALVNEAPPLSVRVGLLDRYLTGKFVAQEE